MEGVEIGNITIPAIKGDKGDKGDAGKIISLSVTMLSSTATPTVTNTGTESEAQYILGIPKGTGISSAVINEDGELVITLTDNTELNLGVIIPTSISNVSLDANYDFIITFSDGTTTVVGNIASEIQDLIDTALTGYYDKDTTDTLLNGKVNVVSGKGLSTNDFTNTLKTKLDGIEANAQVNKIESIKVNNVTQTITNKSVDISVPTKTSDISNDSGYITKDVNNLTNYYKKTEIDTTLNSYATKTYVDNLIGDINNALDLINGEVV